MNKTLHKKNGHPLRVYLLLALLIFSASYHLSAQSNALHFDGTNDHVVLPQFTSTHDFSQGFTFTAWVKWDAFTGNARVFEIGNGSGNVNNSIILRTEASSGNLIFQCASGTTNSEIRTDATVVTAGTWHHVAATISSTGTATIYIDGTAVKSGTVSVPQNVTRSNNWLGKSAWTADNYFKGTMDEVSIWHKTLTQAEIEAIKTNGINSPSSQTGLVAYYQFNQGTANGSNTGITSLTDATANAKHGTLTNFALTGATSNWVEGVTLTTSVPLTVTITKTNQTQTTATNAASLQAAIGSVPLGEVQKMEITAGTFTTDDWLWLKDNRANLNSLTHFIITDGAAAVADIPNSTANNPYFSTQLQYIHVAKVEVVGKFAFNYAEPELLSTVILPDAKTIEIDAFSGSNLLNSIAIPKVELIKSSAFSNCISLSYMMVGETPPSMIGIDFFYLCPTPRYLTLADANGNPLTGTALENARAAYRAVDDGNTSDDLWYGWSISSTLYNVNVSTDIENGSLGLLPNLEHGHPEGMSVTITATPEAGYILLPGSLRAYKTGDESVTVTVANGKFTMPGFDVTVSGEFVSDKLHVNITQTDNTLVTSTSFYTLQEAIGSIPLGNVKKLEITNGNFNTADWQWLQANRTGLSNLTHFTITNSIASVANIPYVTGVSPYFGHQLEEIHVAKLRDIGRSAFDYDQTGYSGTSALTSASFPNLAVLGDYAFYDCSLLTNMLLGATPPSHGSEVFVGVPSSRYLAFADANGNLLTGNALENARAAYKAVNDGNNTDNLWFGWSIDRDLYNVDVVTSTNGILTASNPSEMVFGAYPAGATINVTATPNEGYLFIPNSLRAYKTGDEDIVIPITDNTFTMPDFEVTVTAEFISLTPNVTFVSENTGDLSFETSCSTPGKVYVDWGNGSIETYDTGITPVTLSTDAYTPGSTVKVYGINIDYLNIHGKNITSIDVSNLPALTELRCGSNKLSTLNVSQNTTLLYLSCFENNLSQIDVSQNSALEYLDIDDNNITHLDVSQNPLLKTLYCSHNRLSIQSLPSRKATYTTYLYSPQENLATTCTNGIVDLSSQLTALDVAGNTQKTVYAWYLTNGTALVEDVDYTESNGVFFFLKMPASDVYCTMTNAAFPALTLRTVDITVDSVVEPTIMFISQKDGELLIAGRTLDGSPILVDWGDGTLVAHGVVTSYNHIQFTTSSYVAGNTVKIYGYQFEDIDLSGYDYNEEDYTVANEIVSLDVSRATSLDVLYCEKNNLTELDVSNNTALRVLYIESNNLSSIDVSKNSMLEVLSLYDNNLTFASLPQRKISYNTYDYQPQHDLAATCTFGIVDLSSQLTAVDVDGNTQNTVYTWFLEDETPLVVDVDYTVSNGVFYFQQLPTSPVYCNMTNAAFPDLTLRTVDIIVDMVAPTPLTWTGEADLNWHNPLNWDLEVVPDQTHIVTVPVGSKYPIIWFETTASCHSITLKGDATGIASVINYGTLNAVYGVSVERYAPAGAFEYISSPVENKTAKVFDPLATSPATGNGLFEFNTAGNAWSAPITNAETPLTAMKGFAFIAKESGTVTFKGDAFYTGNQSIALTKTATTGFNLVGNPYPSAISWGSMSGWERENVSPVIWINYADAPGDANFASYNHLTPDAAINWLGNVGTNLGAVAPTQSFWVLAETDGATLTVLPNAQVLSTNVVNKKSAGTNPLIRLQAQRAGYTDEMVIYFHPEAAEGMDRYDTRKKLGSGAYPQIYAPVADAIAAVNTLPQSLLSDKVIVPITLKSDMAGSITMALTELKNLGDDMNVILTDKATGSQTDLRTAAYTVEVEAGSTLTGRLEVTIERKNVTSAPAIDKSTVNIYASAKNIYVGMAQQGSRMEVYNAIGVQMLSHILNGSAVESIPTNLPKGVYIVVVNGSEGRTVKRVFIQ